jgi:molecular chaperone DnaK
LIDDTMKDVIVGIDLGTTNSAVGVVDSGFPILLADREGRRLVPSAVWFGEDGEVEVGHAALRRRAVDPVVTSVKRLIGKRPEEAGGMWGGLPLRDAGVGVLEIEAGRRVTPEEVSAEILKELRRIAEDRLGCAVARAVITVPAYFNEAQRAATKRAGEMAGFVVERLVAEPTAAALAYGLDRLEESSRVAVYDLGGGTFDVSILELRGGVFEVMATAGDTALGGDDFDRGIADLVSNGLTVPAAMEVRLTEEARRVKCLLSEREEAEFALPFYDGERSLARIVTRDEFEKVLEPWMVRTETCCRRALADAGLLPAELDAVVLVGGSTRIPMVRERVAAVFGREPDLTQHPDEAIGLGAAIQAGVLSGAVREVLLLDVTPLSLGIETLGGLMNVLIPRNTTIPCKAGEMFTNARDGQGSMRVRVLQGERELARDNWELGAVEVEFESAPRGKARVGVQFSLDENGMLEVLVRDVATGQDTILAIKSAAVDVTSEAVERMVDESVEHAWEDMNARIFAEARLKAEELLPAVEGAVRDWSGIMDEAELERIRKAKDRVELAMAGASAAELKGAVEDLDGATEALAARLVERAMAERLERRMDGEN